MTPEQLTWTDTQWARHLQWKIDDIPALRKWMTEHYFPVIIQSKESRKFYFCLTKLRRTPSGHEYETVVISSQKGFLSAPDAIKDANEVIIPGLEFNPARAQIMGVPPRALQMLHIYEKQK